MGDGLKKIYEEIPGRYDLVNHVMTLGLDKPWRRRAAAVAAEGGGERWLDICSGTGEMAAGLLGFAPTGCKIFATDYSMPMLSMARRKRGMEGVGLAVSEAASLPYADSTFDLVTCSFAMRNLNSSKDDLLGALREVRRVLKDGGRFMNLETSRPCNAFVRSIFHSYVRLFVKPIGSAMTGSRAGYGYLAGSIRRFYGASELEELLLDAGYRGVACERLMFGVVAIHLAVR